MEKKKANSLKRFFQKIGRFFLSIAKGIKKSFRNLNEKIVHNKLYTLVVMQLKDKWNISFKADKKGTLFKIVGYVIVFAAITFVVHLLMDFAGSKLSIFMEKRIPVSAMVPLIAIISILEIFAILVEMTRTLFFAKDNAVLITYPVKSDYLFLSKLIVYYLDALKKMFTLFLPIVISFGMIYGYPVYFYVLAIILTIIYVAVLVLLCGVLSIPTYYILRFIDHFRIIKLILAGLITGLLIYGTIKLVNVIPSNINLVEEYQKFSVGLTSFLTWFSKAFWGFKVITYWICGVKNGLEMSVFSNYTWAVTLGLFAIIVALIFVNAYLSKPFYHKMIAASNTRNTRPAKQHKNHRRFHLISLIHYELIRTLRDTRIVAGSIVSLVFMPLLILVVNRVYSSFDTRTLGEIIIYVANYSFIFIVTFSHNITSSYLFSKDGPSWVVNKTMPRDPRITLSVRLIYNLIVTLGIIIPSSLIFFNSFKSQSYSSTLFILSLIAFSVFHILLSASFDFSHSKNKEKADIGSEIRGSHELVSLAFGFLTLLVSLVMYVLFVLKHSSNPQTRLFILGCVLMVFEAIFFIRKIRLTFQEN